MVWKDWKLKFYLKNGISRFESEINYDQYKCNILN